MCTGVRQEYTCMRAEILGHEDSVGVWYRNAKYMSYVQYCPGLEILCRRRLPFWPMTRRVRTSFRDPVVNSVFQFGLSSLTHAARVRMALGQAIRAITKPEIVDVCCPSALQEARITGVCNLHFSKYSGYNLWHNVVFGI